MLSTGIKVLCRLNDKGPRALVKGENTMDTWWIKLVEQIVNSISPELRKAVIGFVEQLEKQAKATPNPWDDVFVGVLKLVLAIK